MTKNEAKEILHEKGLRSTGPRLAVMLMLAEAERPLSNTEVQEQLGDTDWDPATIYRNLVKLREAGIASIVSRAEGIDRYTLSTAEEHHHPHFVCEDCGRVECLPVDVMGSITTEGPWATSVARATVQLRGECPRCIDHAGPR